MSFSRNLFKGAWAWYYFVAGYAGVKFSLPQKVSNSYTTLSFCSWYALVSSKPEYNINNTCLREIKAKYDSRRGSTKTRL